MQLTTETMQFIREVGVAAFIVILLAIILFMFVMILRDRDKRDTKESGAVTHIALDSTEEAFQKSDKLVEVYKELGTLRQELGMAQGQNIILMDNFKTLEQKREASEVVTKDKIYALTEKVEKQTVLISRHEGRIIQLEAESKQKDDVIAAKEAEIVELKIDNARYKIMVETQETKLAEQERAIQLLNRTQSLDDTIQLTEAELLELADPVLPVPLIEAPTPETPPTETNEKKDKAA